PDIIRLLEPAQDGAAIDAVVSAQIQFLLGEAYYRSAKYPEALQHYRRALDLQRGAGDRTAEGRTLRSIAQLHKNRGAYADGLAACDEAIALFRTIDND